MERYLKETKMIDYSDDGIPASKVLSDGYGPNNRDI